MEAMRQAAPGRSLATAGFRYKGPPELHKK
jgi:hypothetical protein